MNTPTNPIHPGGSLLHALLYAAAFEVQKQEYPEDDIPFVDVIQMNSDTVTSMVAQFTGKRISHRAFTADITYYPAVKAWRLDILFRTIGGTAYYPIEFFVPAEMSDARIKRNSSLENICMCAQGQNRFDPVVYAIDKDTQPSAVFYASYTLQDMVIR